jgi:hypothetical protein
MEDIDDPRFIRQPEDEKPAEPGSEIVDLGDLELVKLKPDALVVDLPDGSISINFGPFGIAPDDEASDHDANLAQHVSPGTLGAISDDLIRMVTDDIQRQDRKLSDIVKGLDLLGITLEEPKSEPNDAGISVVKHPLLLEAVLRFQANARGELLPSDGPVKVANEGDGTVQLDAQANQLEQDFNFYLTSTAKEYVPDFDRMLFSLGLVGEAYRKIYWHPLKRRPVAETIDRKDIILSDGAVSLEACSRITHRSRMRPSIVKQMQLAGAWRDVPLTSGVYSPDLNVVDRKLDDIAGVMPKLSIGGQDEQDREIYECYCELDLEGFEHEEDGEKTGLPLPYRVTIDKDSREILEIRRWWQEGDKSYVRQEVFVEYVFVPAYPGTNLGFLQILGNASRALTAAWRIAIDAGMLGNFPGGIMARSTGKQQTSNIRVGPGQVAPIDVDGVPLNQAFMPLPYKGVDAGFVAIIQNVEQTAQRLGGTAETAVGEGRNDAPVGTTIAMIEQSTKVISAVHKRLHTAQSKEFELLKELFIRDPESLWRSNKNPKFQQDAYELQQALENRNLVPRADPNTSSQTLRIQKGIALYTLASQNPSAFDQKEVYKRLLNMLDIDDADALFSKAPPGPPPVDETKMMDAKAKIITAQAKMMDTSIKAQNAQGDMSMKMAQLQTQNIAELNKKEALKIDARNHAADRQSKLQLEGLRLKQTEMVHKDKLKHDANQNLLNLGAQHTLKGLDLGHQRQLKGFDLMHAMQTKGLDLDHAREQNAMQMAQSENQSAAQRLHEQAMAQRQSDAAREAQFMKSEGEKE